MNEAYRKRFWSKVDYSNPDGCWEWQAYRLKGHGRVSYKGKAHYAHRVSWILNIGEIPEGMCVLHKCNNRPCVNPDHLYIGDYRDNAIDRSKDGTNPKMKLDAGDVRVMRELLNIGTNRKALAWLFDIHESSIDKIHRGLFYQWVT